MSHSKDLPDKCNFGHIVAAYGGKGDPNLKEALRDGKITSLSHLQEEGSVSDILGQWKKIKLSAGSQGTGLGAIMKAMDDLDTGMDYTMNKVSEGVYVPPQSQMHSQFMERKQQAENNIKQTMQSYQQLEKQKHMLQHDIRKLRSRVEAINARDETLLKGDFIELVDGAGQSPRQGGDQMSLKAYRDQNTYPSIVADFNEMDSVKDLMSTEQKAREHQDKDENDFEDGLLADLPENEKAILKKKYKMYEQWKDLYGSEIERKLQDLKGQMKNIERSIKETEEWLEPYVRDVNMIHKIGNDQEDPTGVLNIRGNSNLIRTISYLGYKGMKLENGGLVFEDDEDKATHFRVVWIDGHQINLANNAQPQTPADGPSTAIVTWKLGFVCRHVFENIIHPKIKEFDEKVDQVMEDYTGEFSTDDGDKLKEARNAKEISVRDLRKEIEGKVDDNKVPLQLSSDIRRVEDGLETIETALDEKYIKAINEILEDELDEKFLKENEESNDSYNDFKQKYMTFLGKTDPFYMENPEDGVNEFAGDLKSNYYYDYKQDQNLFTMK
ncbi:MAG: hypothetical protein V5A72_01255 [Candidatus Nanohaloarchaea archaeon]